MDLKKLNRHEGNKEHKEYKKHKRPPCKKCPYRLGLMRTFINPCPQCRGNGYLPFESMIRKYGYGGE